MLAAYGTVVQNLRLIRAPGHGVWAKQDRRWSEAAVAADGSGRVLFLFTRQPYSMQELNAKLLALPLGITAAMHVEGGPEASLSIHAGGVDLDLNGSYETGFNENDDEAAQWPIRNVLGVARQPLPRRRRGSAATRKTIVANRACGAEGLAASVSPGIIVAGGVVAAMEPRTRGGV